MDDLANLEHTNLLEGPLRELRSEIAVGSSDGLVTELGLLSKPLVLE
jgi:hypothetical protein